MGEGSLWASFCKIDLMEEGGVLSSLRSPGADVLVGVREKLYEFLFGVFGETFGNVLGPKGTETFGRGF